jgi:hypothetical protein
MRLPGVGFGWHALAATDADEAERNSRPNVRSS